MSSAFPAKLSSPSTRDDISMLRDLTKHYLDVCNRPVQSERRRLWRKKNSLKPVRPLIFIHIAEHAWNEMPQSQCKCEDPFYRYYEDLFRQTLFRDTLDGDEIFEPWISIQATRYTPPEGLWGFSIPITYTEAGGYRWDHPLKNPDDIKKLAVCEHRIDEQDTSRNVARLSDAIGDLITINIDRQPIYTIWNADISTQLGFLRGLEQFMLDMIDRPDWLKEVLSFMRDGILKSQEQAEQAGDWKLCDHYNQAMPYAEELDDPAPNGESVTRDKLWGFCASQETTLVSPEMFDEFMLQYQRPIIEKFGLSSYGCCEDLTNKIDKLRQISNLRRIAVAPAANVAKCAEQIGKDYVISYRPSPADMVSYGFNPERIRKILRRDLRTLRDCYIDITLKDVETVEHDPERIRNWVKIAREVIDTL